MGRRRKPSSDESSYSTETSGGSLSVETGTKGGSGGGGGKVYDIGITTPAFRDKAGRSKLFRVRVAVAALVVLLSLALSFILITFFTVRGRTTAVGIVDLVRDQLRDNIALNTVGFMEIPFLMNKLDLDAHDLGELHLLNVDTWEQEWEKHCVVRLVQYPTNVYIQIATESGYFLGCERTGLAGSDQEQFFIHFANTSLYTYSVDMETFVRDELIGVRPNFNVLIRPWYASTKDADDDVWSEPYRYFDGSQTGYTVGSPIRYANGSFAGVVASDFVTSHLNEWLNTLETSENGEVVILDSLGRIVSSSVVEDYGYVELDGIVVDTHKLHEMDNEVLRTAGTLLNSLHGEAWIADREERSIYEDGYFVDVIPARDQVGMEWTVILAMPADDFLGFIKDDLTNSVIVAAIILTVTVLVALGLANWMTVPLVRMSEEAQAANRAKSEFLVNMNHELRTPLNGVLGMAYLLEQTPLSETQFQMLSTMKSSGKHLLVVINDILDMSKIEAGKLELEQAPFDMRNCFEEAINVVLPSASQKNLRLACLMDLDTPWRAVGDVTRIRQVAINLLSNAIKFTDEGEVVITISMGHLSKDRKKAHKSNGPRSGRVRVIVDVDDSGIGIPEEQRTRLFKKFERVTWKERKFGGTGLGLAISRHLCQMMGGSMWLQSNTDASAGKLGSTFSFSFVVDTAPVGFGAVIPPYLNYRPPELDGMTVGVQMENTCHLAAIRLYLNAWGVRAVSIDDPKANFHEMDAVIVESMRFVTRKGKLRPRSGQHFDVPLICCYNYGHAVPAVVNADTLRLPFRLADFYDKLVAALTPLTARSAFSPRRSSRNSQEAMAPANPIRPILPPLDGAGAPGSPALQGLSRGGVLGAIPLRGIASEDLSASRRAAGAGFDDVGTTEPATAGGESAGSTSSGSSSSSSSSSTSAACDKPLLSPSQRAASARSVVAGGNNSVTFATTSSARVGQSAVQSYPPVDARAFDGPTYSNRTSSSSSSSSGSSNTSSVVGSPDDEARIDILSSSQRMPLQYDARVNSRDQQYFSGVSSTHGGGGGGARVPTQSSRSSSSMQPPPSMSQRQIVRTAIPPVQSHSSVWSGQPVPGIMAAEKPIVGGSVASGVEDLRILVVEDNPVNVLVLVGLLERLGCPADHVENGRLGVEAVLATKYDLVFMDIQMPVMDGLEATREIRKTVPAALQPWVVACTAHTMKEEVERALQSGMDGFMNKPVKIESLQKVLRDASAVAASGETPGGTGMLRISDEATNSLYTPRGSMTAIPVPHVGRNTHESRDGMSKKGDGKKGKKTGKKNKKDKKKKKTGKKKKKDKKKSKKNKKAR